MGIRADRFVFHTRSERHGRNKATGAGREEDTFSSPNNASPLRKGFIAAVHKFTHPEGLTRIPQSSAPYFGQDTAVLDFSGPLADRVTIFHNHTYIHDGDSVVSGYTSSRTAENTDEDEDEDDEDEDEDDEDEDEDDEDNDEDEDEDNEDNDNDNEDEEDDDDDDNDDNDDNDNDDDNEDDDEDEDDDDGEDKEGEGEGHEDEDDSRDRLVVQTLCTGGGPVTSPVEVEVATDHAVDILNKGPSTRPSWYSNSQKPYFRKAASYAEVEVPSKLHIRHRFNFKKPPIASGQPESSVASQSPVCAIVMPAKRKRFDFKSGTVFSSGGDPLYPDKHQRLSSIHEDLRHHT